MQIINFLYRHTDCQVVGKVMCSSPHVFFVFFYIKSIRLSSFIIDVPLPLSNDIWIILFQMVIA